MKTIRELLHDKHKNPTTIGPERSVFEALRQMVDTDVGAAMVVEGGKLIGVLSERDYVRKVALAGLASDTPVSEVMTTGVVSVTPESTVEECMALMLQKHIRHLPVVDGATVIGVISVRDVVKATLQEKEFRIDQLENYISGR